MKHVARIVIFLSILAIIAAIIVLLIKKKENDNNERQHAPMTGFYYSESGDMNGSSSMVKLQKTADGRVLLTDSKSVWFNQDNRVKEYYVAVSILEEMEQLYDAYRIYRLPDMPDSEEYALDGGTGYYRFMFEDGASVRFDTDQDIPTEYWEGVRKIREIISEAEQEGELLPGLVIPGSGENPDLALQKPEFPQKGILLQVYEYSEEMLHFRMGQDSVETEELSKTVFLYRLDAEGKKELYSNQEDGTWYLHMGFWTEESIEPDCGRLAPGRYMLAVSGLETEFDIA